MILPCIFFTFIYISNKREEKQTFVLNSKQNRPVHILSYIVWLFQKFTYTLLLKRRLSQYLIQSNFFSEEFISLAPPKNSVTGDAIAPLPSPSATTLLLLLQNIKYYDKTFFHSSQK